MEFDLVIRGGTVVTAADVGKSDVGVKDGRIVALAEDLPRAASEIDASGLLVLPGGIDSHVHFDQPQGPGIVMADGFESGTRSAAAGGNTTVLAFALQPRGQSLRESVESYHEKAKGKCYVDYGFHLIVTDPTPAVLGQELPALVSSGYPSFKVFMTYDNMVLTDRQLLEVFTVAREQGATVMVHAEGYDQIKYMTDRLERDGKTHPYFHAESRPELVEREATHRAISHAELIGIPIMIVHVSGREAMEQIEWARGRGLKIYAETCPQYLVLDRRGSQRPQHGFLGRRNMSARRRRAIVHRKTQSGAASSAAFSRRFPQTIARFDSKTRMAKATRRGGPLFAGCRTAFRASRRGCRSCFPRASKKDAFRFRSSSR